MENEYFFKLWENIWTKAKDVYGKLKDDLLDIEIVLTFNEERNFDYTSRLVKRRYKIRV